MQTEYCRTAGISRWGHRTIKKETGASTHQSPVSFLSGCRLFKISVQQALECSSVSCLILCHLMNGVMNCIEVLLLSTCSEILLACACASLSLNTHLEVLLCGVCNDFAQELSKLGSMLCLFMSSLLIVKTNFRITLTESNSCHSQVHTYLRALTCEVRLQVLDDLRIYALCDADNMLICKSGILIHLIKLRSRSSALWTFLRSFWPLINVSAN